jgi:AraC-like DNA-binding protein
MPQINFGKEKYYYFSELTPARAKLPFYIEQVGITYSSPKYYIERNENSSAAKLGIYIIEYVDGGKGYIEQGGRRYTVTEGDFYIINAKFPHKYYSDKHDPFTKYWINAGGKVIEGLLSAYGMTAPVVIRRVDVKHIFESMIEIIVNNDNTNHSDIYSLLTLKTCEILVAAGNYDKRPASPDEVLAQSIKRYIDLNQKLNPTLTEIRKKFSISEAHIIALFREKYGMTPKQYILKNKISTASYMIKTGGHTIKELSYALGFSSTQHFSNVFKKFTGKTPGEYKNN